MTLHIRRVVTGHDADGKAVIVADGEAPRSWASALRARPKPELGDRSGEAGVIS